ncbi:MAG: hypothetical protein ACLVH8_10020 [Fusobacterium sp.]
MVLFYIFFLSFLRESDDMGAITKRIEFEIRMRFELGEDLKDLAVIYKVPLSTLKKRKQKAEIKGSRSKSAYETFAENEKQRRKELREKINSKARVEFERLEKIIDDTYEESDEILNAEVEKAVLARAGRIDMFLELRKKIEDIPTMKEEAEIEKIKMDIELKKKELEDKNIEIKIKKAEAKMLLGDDKVDL